MCLIPANAAQLPPGAPKTLSEYFARMLEESKAENPLPLLRKPCGDCAMTCGFYGEYGEALAQESPEVQLGVSQQWFCHNHTGRACKGNAQALGLSW